jgi:hypothetical protein
MFVETSDSVRVTDEVPDSIRLNRDAILLFCLLSAVGWFHFSGWQRWIPFRTNAADSRISC